MYTKLLLCAGFIFAAFNAVALPITLMDAIKQNKVSAMITGNKTTDNPNGSSHTGKCLLLKLTNNSPSTIEIKIESAYQFVNQTKANQDLISTENLIVSIAGNQTKNVAVNALCSEKNNSSPAASDTFTLTKKHDAAISNLTLIFEKYKCYLNTAQQALWCFTDNNSLESIYDTNTDTVVENKLVFYVSSVKGIPLPVRKYYVSTPRIIKYPVEVDSTISLHIEAITTIGIYITDSSHQIIKTLIEDDTERRIGTAKYSYFYRGQCPKGKYFVAMKKNGVWVDLQTLLIGE